MKTIRQTVRSGRFDSVARFGWRGWGVHSVLGRSFTEWVGKSKAEQRRADAAEERALEQARLATAARRLADEEHQRAERLAARLRELGIEPE
jgi:hypothetical protein